jgi:rhamnulokinase
MKYHLAIDIGASSGRHIVGRRENGEMKTKEVFRFPNGMIRKNGALVWDIEALVASVKEGIERAEAEFGRIDSLAVDAWGADYVLLYGDESAGTCFAYRDGRGERAAARLHERISRRELYMRTGSQYQPFNTVYQLYDDLLAGRLEGATDFLMIPEYILYRLCGSRVKEYTAATTTGLVGADSGRFDTELTSAVGLPERLFGELARPGKTVGEYKGIRCVLCAGHDTASAVEGIPMRGGEIYISSGTWSLLGTRTERCVISGTGMEKNWSNEGGPGYNRFQKNIMGMWIINGLRERLCPDVPLPELISAAERSGYDGTLDANAPELFAPEDMKAAFDGLLSSPPPDAAGYMRCACRSLALCFAEAVKELENETGVSYHEIYVVGGGAKNAFINRLTEQATGKKVTALPIEASALGNLKIQAEAETYDEI